MTYRLDNLVFLGKDLFAVVTALRQWGDRWIFGAGHEPSLIVDRRTGRPIPRLRILGEDGQPLGALPRAAPAPAPRRPPWSV